eukprot:8575107-Lingulodinium_polyedra.AAC.1
MDLETHQPYASVCLVGKARASKEVRIKDLPVTEKSRFRQAMQREWDTFNAFGATKYLSKADLQRILAAKKPPRI